MGMEQEPETLVLQEHAIEEEETGLLRKSFVKSKNNGALVAAEDGNDTVSSSTSSSSSSSNSELGNGCENVIQEGEENGVFNGSNDEEKAEVNEENGSLLSHSVFLDKDQGAKTNGKEHNVVENSTNETDFLGEYENQGNQGSEIEPQNVMNKEEQGSGLHSESFGKIQQQEITNNGSTIKDGLDEIEEVDEEPTEYDVETVVKKQNTHDIYCPNCHSCITKKVILRRKRRVRKPRTKSKGGKVDIFPESGLADGSSKLPDTQPRLVDSPAFPSDTQSPLPGAEDTDQEAFRCLSCFSYFIPTRNGFKLFCCFGDSDEKHSLINPQAAHEPSKTWFFSLFGPGRKTAEMGAETNKKADMAMKNDELSIGASSYEQSSSPGKATATGSQDTEKKAISSLTEEQLVFHGVLNGATEKSDNAVNKTSEDKLPVKNESTLPLSTTKLPATSTSNGKFVDNENSQTQNIGIASIFSSGKGETMLENVKEIRKDKLEVVVEKPTKGDHAITIEEPVCETSSQGAQVIPAEAESLLESRIPRDTNQWEIIKPIVYGGLMESITSVGIISSAVGADTTTLKVFSLGLANLVGGLVVIIHNLLELKRGQHTTDATRLIEREGDRYKVLLGRRQNFLLHLTVAILSYLLFGSLPPVIYAFSFRQSDDRDLKLAAVAGASLLCIAILAFANAHVRRPPKSYFKTMSQFVLIGASAAGVSYLAGWLINRLMENLGFDLDPNLSVPSSGATAAKSGWAYY